MSATAAATATDAAANSASAAAASASPAPPPLAVDNNAQNKTEEPASAKNCWGMTDERTLWTRVWQGVAGASLAVNLAAMAIEASAVAIVAGIVACAIAPVVFYLQFQLQDTDTLRTVQNQLRQEVNRMHLENNKLSAQVIRLQTQTDKLKEEEAKLEQIVKEQGSTVDTFVGLVDENGKTLDELKGLVKADLTQTVVNAMIDSDFDSSGTFSDQEIKILEMRMKNVPGVHVQHELLVATVDASDRRLSSVLKLLDHLDRDDLADSERIFQFDKKHLEQNKKPPN